MFACPSNNWICSSSPPAFLHSFAQVLRKSCGVRSGWPMALPHLLTSVYTKSSLTASGGPSVPPLRSVRKSGPSVVSLSASQRIEELFDPERDWHGADASSLPFEIEQHPALLPQLQMPHLQADQFVAPQPARHQQSEQGAIAH